MKDRIMRTKVRGSCTQNVRTGVLALSAAVVVAAVASACTPIASESLEQGLDVGPQADGGLADTLEREKLLGGKEVHDRRALKIQRSNGNYCTAIPFFKDGNTSYLLTSGHCVGPGYGGERLSIFGSDQAGKVKSLGSHYVYRTPHPDYVLPKVGEPNDPANDIAVIRMSTFDTSQAPFPQFLYLGEIKNTHHMSALGFGPGSNYSNESVLRTGLDGEGFSPDVVNTKSFEDWNDRDVSLCGGDSGGPALIDFNVLVAVAGVASAASRPKDQSCRTENAYQVWTRIGPHFDWINGIVGGGCRRQNLGNGLEIGICGSL